MSGVIRFVTDDAGAGASGDTMSENAAAATLQSRQVRWPLSQ